MTAGIAVVTPSFNQGRFLESTLRSVIENQRTDVEYRILDGGSTDGSVEVIKRYEDRLAGWESRPDGGPYDAVDRGLKQTSAPIMGWLNSDDLYLPGALRVVEEIFRTFPEVEWLTTLVPLIIDEDDRIVACERVPGFSREAFRRGANLPGRSGLPGFFIMQESTFWRRSLWERAGGGLDTTLRYAADFELWGRFFRHAPLHGLAAPLACFRRHGAQRSKVGRKEYLREGQEVLRRNGGRPYGPLQARLRWLLSGAIAPVVHPALRRLLSPLNLVVPSHSAPLLSHDSGGWRLARGAFW